MKVELDNGDLKTEHQNKLMQVVKFEMLNAIAQEVVRLVKKVRFTGGGISCEVVAPAE